MKTAPRLLIFVGLLAALVLGYRHLVYTGKIPRPNMMKSVIPLKVDEVTASVLTGGATTAVNLPGSSPSTACVDGNTRNCIAGPVHKIEIWAWNANMGLIYAVGSASDGKSVQTSKGSLMEKHAVNVQLVRQDDTGQMQNDLLDTAQRLASDPNADGVKFVTIMGDGGAQFFQAINPKLAKVCPDCIMKTVGVVGYSRGEDAFWGPQAWKDNCQAMRGGLTIGVLRDGDWNIAQKKLAQCQVPNNPDDTVYDPQAMNWVNADSYTKAAEMFSSATGYCEDLPVKGKLGGGKQHICAAGVVTWTPGDVTVAMHKGGVVPILSTRESLFQMPCILVGIDRWMKGHRKDVDGILAAAFEGADQVRGNPLALKRAGEVSAVLYKEETPDYWVKYYRGVKEQDVTGVMVPLGGSAVANLADNIQAFGLSGGPNLFDATYTRFGNLVVQQYPRLVPTFPPVAAITDTSYLKDITVSNTLPVNNPEAAQEYTAGKSMKTIEGRRNYAIQFTSGSAAILPASIPVLNELYSEIVITKYAVAVHGHTDNTGTPDGNMALSESRANAVKTFLVSKGGARMFPEGRIRAYSHGQDEPIASNSTAEGKAMNRRVEIVLGTL